MISKRILIFSTAYLPFIGGAEVAIKEITDRMPDCEFDLITAKMRGDLSRTEIVGAVNVHRVGVGIASVDKLIMPFLGVFKVWNLQRKYRYDAFWCMMVTFASGSAYLVNTFRRMFGMKIIPIVMTLQEGDSEEHLKTKWFGLINLSWRFALPRTTILTTISTYLLDRAKREGYQGQSVVIPNGVNFELFNTPASIESLNHAQEKMQKKDGETMLITTSRLTKKNAVEDIIKSLKSLPESVKLAVLGVGPLESELKSLTKKLRLENRVKFLGFVEHKIAPAYLQSADIFIRPSLSEGMGNSFIEAMASGIPVIATPVGGIVDFLKDLSNTSGQAATGVFCKVHNPESIAEAVNKILNDKNLVETITSNARKMVQEKYDWNLIAEDMKTKVFETL